MQELANETRLIWAPPRDISVSEWAEQYRVLIGQSSAEPGPWRNGRTPYLQGIMEAFSNPLVEQIVMCKGSQIGGTEAIYNMLGYAIQCDPAPALVVYPTIDLAKSISSTRIQPMINHCDSLQRLKPSNADEFTMLSMSFPGMTLTLSGANSPASLASRPCRYVFFDEVDKFPVWTGKEADPISLGRERQKTFWNKKTVIISTPTTETGHIVREMESCDAVFDYHVPCPHCGSMQVLRFEFIKWPDSLDRTGANYPVQVRDAAWYECEECGQHILDIHKPGMLAAGEWRARVAPDRPPRSVGYHLPSFYSPWLTWGDIAEAFVRAKDFPEKLQNVVNSWFAEPWVRKIYTVEASGLELLKNDTPELIVPEGSVCLTAGIDVQKTGFYYTIWSWRRDMSSHLVKYGFVGDWDDIRQMIFETQFACAVGDRKYNIWRAAIDTGGTGTDDGTSRTEEVYQHLRAWPGGVVHGAKGLSKNKTGARVRVSVLDKLKTSTGRIIPIRGGIVLYLLDTAQLKEVFFWRLKEDVNNSQPISFHADTGADFFSHILAEEKRILKNGQVEWVKIRRRNDWLDASIYAHACADPQWSGGVLIARQVEEGHKRPPLPKGRDVNPITGKERGSWWRR